MTRLITTATFALLLFAIIAAVVISGLSTSLDHAGAALFRAIQAPPWLAETARDLTGLGSNVVLGLVSIIAAGYAALTRRRHDAARLLAAPVGCLLLVGIVKTIVGRARPELPLDGPLVFTSSFPSSHAALSAAVLTVGTGILIRQQPSRAVTCFIVSAAAGLSILIGLSRIYLGLHWLSDVLAGWTLGLGWGCLCLAFTSMWGDRRG